MHIPVIQRSNTSCTSFPRLTRVFILLALFVSGANGLILEIVFRRQLLLSLGVTHYSVATVLTVFMAGLALGSLFFGKMADNTRYPLRIYGMLEVGIGLSGFLLLLILPYFDALYASLYHLFGVSDSPGILLKSFLAGGFLLLPTTLMGGTLPVAGKAFVRQNSSAGSPLGFLYGINTLGGVAGILSATFWLLGTLGTNRTLVLVSLLSVFIGLTTILVFGKQMYVTSLETGVAPTKKKALKKNAEMWSEKRPLLVFFISGFAALSLEVYWTRILAYVVGSHGYAFGIILAAFLSGIALGSLLLSRVVRRLKHPLWWLGGIQILIGVMAFGVTTIMFRLRGLTGWLTVYAHGSWNRFITVEMGILFLMLLLPTFCMGSVFPFVMSLIVRNYEKLGVSVGNAYAINTLGSILGAFLAGFVFIPYTGISTGLKITILLSISVGALLLCHSQNRVRMKTGIVLVCGTLGLLVLSQPLGYPLQQVGRDEQLIFYKESSSATVAVREDMEGARMLSINGLDEVPVDPASLLTFRVLAHLPLLLHPHPQEVMVLSLGGGIATGSVARHQLSRIDAIELCPPVVEAAKLFERWNYGVLDDPRLNILVQDGRNHLLTTRKTYDVITADATHPWSADSWMLYTREMYQLARSRLGGKGIFCQWIPLHWMSQEDFRCILRTMRTVFPRMSLWYTGSYVVALGSMTSEPLSLELLEKRMADEKVRQDLESVGITSPASLLALHLMSDRDIDVFVADGPLNTDDMAYLEHSAARCFGRETTPENLTALRESRTLPLSLLIEPQTQPESEVFSQIKRFFEARDDTMRGRIATYKGRFSDAIAHYRAALAQSPQDGVTQILLTDALHTLASFVTVQGDQARRAGKFQQAAAAYRYAIQMESGYAKAHNGLGLLYFSQGEYATAITHFNMALRRLEKQRQIRFNKALALLKLGRTTEAKREMQHIQRLEADGKTAYALQLQEILKSL